MTVEEAIKEIKDASDSEVRYGDKDNHYDKVMKRVEAFDMAIKALEQQPCEDCISRDAVIKIFGEVHPMDYNTLAYIKNIQNLPSVTPKGVTITDFADRCRECGRIKYSNLQDWLSTFNTESATECFTAVQQLKERMNE